MFTKNAFVVLGFVIVFCSCWGKDEQQEIDVINKTLLQAIISITKNNAELYHKLDEQFCAPATREIASMWHPKAMIVREESKGFCNFLDSAKSTEDINWKNINNKLGIYKNKITEISKEVFGNDSSFIQSIDSILAIESINNYTNLSSQLQKSVINRKIFDIGNLENSIIKNCTYNPLHTCGLGMTKTSFLVGQSSTHLKKGDVLTISAGMGEFSAYSRPKISINNKRIEANRGHGIYAFKVNGRFGKKTIPVKVEYIDENGKDRFMTEIVEYTIDQ
jgi:hypothetical protein